MAADYDYLQLTTARGPAARRAFVDHLTACKADLGGEILGLFTAQLGWEAAYCAVLVRWPAGRRVRGLDPIVRSSHVLGHTCQHLEPTLRPADDAALDAGGVWVHRWFETAAADLDEFKRLSGEGWKDFEPRFDARVFGLFLASETEADRRDRSRRLLLLTRYGDHGVWEASRDPSTEAMQTFGRRALLTRRTHAASTLLTVP